MTPSSALTEKLIAKGVLHTPAIIDAFRAVDRQNFLPLEQRPRAYHDIPLSIGHGQTISQPYTVAFLLERLQPQAGDNILDIGSGSGWQTALLAHITGPHGHVTGLELIPELCAASKVNLARYPTLQSTIDIHCANGRLGYSPRAPYHKIIAAAAGDAIPSAWRTQTQTGGCIVAPVGSDVIQLIRKNETDWEQHTYPGFAFVPLVQPNSDSS